MTNNRALFVASFLTLIAAGVGFAIRGQILDDWASQFGFTMYELGGITGGGLVGFGLVILAASAITDAIGYKPIMILAFLMHVLSAAVTLAATPVFNATSDKTLTFYMLAAGALIFSIANGLCEAVINPLVATLYPKQKTHYLNILHAGWPGGLIIGSLLAKCVVGGGALVASLRWEVPMSFFLVPTIIYGIIVLKERFPDSEAKAAGVKMDQSFALFASPILLLLLLLHACVGYVELGTDSWISSITDKFTGQGLYLFLYASTVMFVLRFFAGPIVERINPLGLLFLSAVLGTVGLYMIGSFKDLALVWIAMTIYALGKTFLWPTMLGVVGERFPQGGAIVMGAMGGIGMLSAGLLGGPGIGYKQDLFASQNLKAASVETYDRYKAGSTSSYPIPVFPVIQGLAGDKVGVVKDDGKKLAASVELLKKENREIKAITDLNSWWQTAKESAPTDKPLVENAEIYGGQMALKWTAVVPLSMAIGYLILVLYYQAIGGYRQVVLHGQHPDGERYTGGVEGPVE